jgi:hypothetical protein
MNKLHMIVALLVVTESTVAQTPSAGMHTRFVNSLKTPRRFAFPQVSVQNNWLIGCREVGNFG